MPNSYYNHGSYPATGSPATSASMRAELQLIAGGFDKLPTLSGNQNKLVVVNSTGTGLEATGTLPAVSVTDSTFTVSDNADATRQFRFEASSVTAGSTRVLTVPNADTTIVGTDVAQTLTNKTLTTPVLSGTASGTTAGRLGYLSGAFTYGNGSVQRTVVNTDESQALTNKTYNGLTPTAAATGFTIAGGTTSKTLTVNNTVALSGTDGSTLNIGSGGTLGSAAFTDSTAYIGSTGATTITTLGTITTGTWSATTIATARGGTGLTSFTTNGAVYATSTSALTTGTLPAASGGTGLTSFTTNGAVYATSTSALTTGTLPVASGGTGTTSVTGVLKGNGTSAFTAATAETDYVTPSGTGTLTNKTLAGVTINGNLIMGTTGSIRELRAVLSGTAIDLNTGNYFTRTNSGATSFTVSNVQAAGKTSSFILDLTNGGSGAITWWSGMKWAGGTAPTLTASGRDILGFFTHDGGTTWNGLLLAKDIK